MILFAAAYFWRIASYYVANRRGRYLAVTPHGIAARTTRGNKFMSWDELRISAGETTLPVGPLLDSCIRAEVNRLSGGRAHEHILLDESDTDQVVEAAIKALEPYEFRRSTVARTTNRRPLE